MFDWKLMHEFVLLRFLTQRYGNVDKFPDKELYSICSNENAGRALGDAAHGLGNVIPGTVDV
jgi:hypothetical protein